MTLGAKGGRNLDDISTNEDGGRKEEHQQRAGEWVDLARVRLGESNSGWYGESERGFEGGGGVGRL